MPYINPYIEKIHEHPHIWQEEERIFAHKGKWRGFFLEHNLAYRQAGAESTKQKGETENNSSLLRRQESIPDGFPLSREGREKQLMVEIGTGMGNFFATYASLHPDTACVGIELKYKRLYRTYEKCAQKGRGDVVLLKVRGEEIGQIFGPEEIDELYILFSDPWPKKAHHKHRLIQDQFLQDAAKVLKKDGVLIIKTDHAGYAEWIEERLLRSADFSYEKTSNEDPDKRASPENSTEFETMGRSEGSMITSFLCKKT